MKKITSIILAILMVLSSFAVLPMTVFAATESAAETYVTLGKDLEIEWGLFYRDSGNNPVITTEGDNAVATGGSGWTNDGCADFTIKNIPVAGKYLILNINAESASASLATAGNIVVTAGSSSVTLDADLTVGGEFVFDISGLGDITNITTIDSIKVRAFKHKSEDVGKDLRNVKVVVGAVSTMAELPVEGEINVILGKDLDIAWNGFYTNSGNNPVITTEGDNAVATGSSGWTNDGCADFTINNIPVAGKYLFLNIKAESTSASPATTGNIRVTAGSSSVTLDADLTVGGEFVFDISELGDITTIDSIWVRAFKHKSEDVGKDLKNVKVVVGAVSTAPYAVTLRNEAGEVTEVKPAGAIFKVPTAPSATEGFRFSYWTADGDTKYYVDDEITVNGDITLYPVFERVTEWYVTYMVDGDIYYEAVVELNGEITHPETPEAPEGYKFAGWYDQNGSIVYNGDVVTGDLVLTARMTEADAQNDEFLNALLIVLKMIVAKKEAAATTTDAILGKDLEVVGNIYYTHADNSSGIKVEGNATVAYGDSNWVNDGCANLTINNVAISGADKLVINMKAFSSQAKLASADNVVVTAGDKSVTLSADFNTVSEAAGDITLDVSSLGDYEKIDSIKLVVFELKGGQLEDVEVVINSIAGA